MSTLSQFTGGGVKSVQSGVTVGAGAVTITAVNTAKSVIHSVSKGSAGTVAATGTAAAGGLDNLFSATTVASGYAAHIGNPIQTHAKQVSTSANAISGGTTNLTAKQYSAVLTNTTTTITADGPCEWQVVEYY